MIKRQHTHLVQDEVSPKVYFSGTYETCRDYIANLPDDEWEYVGIVSRTTGRFVSFIIPAGESHDRTQYKQ